MIKPNIKDDRDWNLIWNDEFTGSKLNTKKWRTETISPDFQGNNGQASQHQTNNFGIDEDGNLGNGKYPVGKRHALWYNKHTDETIKVENGSLVMGALKTNEDDPTIKSSHHPYTHPRDGKEADFRKKIYTGWVDTYAMSWHDGALRPARQESPNFYFRYGFVELGVNFEEMHTDGLRCSGWLLPAVDPAKPDVSLVGGTYDDSAANGLECDIFEYEPAPGCEHFLLCKNIGANAIKLPPVDLRKFGIDITKGDHTIAVYWDNTVTIWYVDGIEVCRDAVAIVHIAMALYITREGNSGVNSGDGAKSDGALLQNDPGLWGYNVGTQSAETINSDKSRIRYIRVWQNSKQKDNWIAPDWRDGNGVEDATATVINVPKPSKPTKSIPVPEMPQDQNDRDFGIRIDGNVLSWKKTHELNKYDIKYGKNEYKASVTGTTFTIPDNDKFPEGTYYVTSTPKNKKFVDSAHVEYSKSAKVSPVSEVVEVVKETVAADESAATLVAKMSDLVQKLQGLLKK